MAADQHENYPTVSIHRTESVYPKLLHLPEALELSNLDRQCAMPMYTVFFYRSSQAGEDHLSLDSVFHCLKEGLEETLDLWYPAAGRLRLDASDGKLNLWCNNEGVVLVGAVTQIKISELGDLSLYNDLFENLVYKPAFVGDFSLMPLVTAQVTKFGCGGYSIGVGTSHSLFDGRSAYTFFNDWALNSGIVKEIKPPGHKIQKPVHERTPLVGPGSNIQDTKPVARAIDHLYQLISQATSGQYEFDERNYLFQTFHLSAAMIESFRDKVSTESGDFPCSTFDVLAAQLWKARTKALAQSPERMVCLQFSVDARKKMVPPLPESFSGNAFVLVSVALESRQVLEASHKDIVEKIREAKNSVNEEYVKAYMGALEGSQASLPPMMELTVVSDLTRLPFHKVGFLNEEAEYACPLVPPVPQVAFFLQSPKHSRNIDVRIGLLPENLEAFSYHFLADFQ